MDKSAPPLLPILRSRQQGQVLAWILDDPDREVSVSELSRILNISQPTVHRDIEQAIQAGIVRVRQAGRTKLIAANQDSVYFSSLRDLMVRSFGVPCRLAGALQNVPGIEGAYIYGSWAARFVGESGTRPVGDIDLLVLGNPDEDHLYQAVEGVRPAVGYEIQVTVRPAGWLREGTGSFHDTVVSRPMVAVLSVEGQPSMSSAAAMASEAQE